LAIDELEQRANLFMLTYIGSFSLDFTWPIGLQFGNRAGDRIRPAAANHHQGAFGEHHLGNGASDAAGSAGNQANFAFQYFC